MLEDKIKQRIENLRLILLGKSPSRGPGKLRLRPLSIQDIENARETGGKYGNCLLIEKEVDEYVRAESLKLAGHRLLGGADASPSFVFLDLETTGFSLSSATSKPASAGHLKTGHL